MGVYIRDAEKPKDCWECFNYDCGHWGEHGYDNSTDCPLIEIDIVRCGECNHSGTDGENTFCMWLGALRKPTDFCNYGERRE